MYHQIHTHLCIRHGFQTSLLLLEQVVGLFFFFGWHRGLIHQIQKLASNGWTFSYSMECVDENLATHPKWMDEPISYSVQCEWINISLLYSIWVDELLATHSSLLLGGSWFIIIINILLRTSGSGSLKNIRIVLVF